MAPQQPHDHTRGNVHGLFFPICQTLLNLCFSFVSKILKCWLTDIHISPQDTRFKVFRNGTLRINNVEVYDGQMYGCETKTLGGRLSGHARVTVLGELRESLKYRNLEKCWILLKCANWYLGQ